MKTWIRRTLIATAGAAVLAAGLAGCGSPQRHGGWNDERLTEMRGKAVERIGDRMSLDATQRARLEALAEELQQQHRTLRGADADPRAPLKALVAGEKFDRAKARALLDEKAQAVQSQGPKVLEAFGDFYDSLTPTQQAQLREWLDRRGHGGWWRRG